MANKVFLVGNVGNAPEVKTLDSGNKVANFSLATSESFKNKDGEKVTETEWHRCVVWGKRAEVIEKYVEKGQKLCVEGKIKYRNWEDDQGNKKYATDINVSDFEFLGGGSNNQEAKQAAPEAPETNNDPEEDLPF